MLVKVMSRKGVQRCGLQTFMSPQLLLPESQVLLLEKGHNSTWLRVSVKGLNDVMDLDVLQKERCRL